MTDVTYTHAADTTSDSHYRVNPLPGTPTNWRSLIDYASGAVRVHLEVKTKPSDAPTRFQVCFETTQNYGCTDQSPVYTKPVTCDWTTKFDDFYYGGDVDWSKGVSKIALILKDDKNNKPHGDPKFVPTDLRVEVALLTAGAAYEPTACHDGVSDAGVADAGRTDASAGGDASPDAHDAGTAALSSDASAPASDAAAAPARDAGTARPGSGKDAASPGSASDASAARDASASHDDAGDDAAADDYDNSGCSLARSAGGSSWFWSMAAVLIVTGYRRRRLQRKRAA